MFLDPLWGHSLSLLTATLLLFSYISTGLGLVSKSHVVSFLHLVCRGEGIAFGKKENGVCDGVDGLAKQELRQKFGRYGTLLDTVISARRKGKGMGRNMYATVNYRALNSLRFN
jgi:hypothetical protein